MLNTLILEAEKKEAEDGKHLYPKSQHELDNSADEENIDNTDNVTMEKEIHNIKYFSNQLKWMMNNMYNYW